MMRVTHSARKQRSFGGSRRRRRRKGKTAGWAARFDPAITCARCGRYDMPTLTIGCRCPGGFRASGLAND